MREEQIKLESLQRLDARIIDLKDELDRFSRSISELKTRLDTKKAQLEEKQQQLKKLENEKSDLEKMLFIEQERLKKTRTRLVGSGVKNPHAFNANQREVDKIKKDIEAIEEGLLKAMQGIEEQRAAVGKVEKEVGENEQELAETDKAALERGEALKSKIAEIDTDRKRLAGEVSPKVLALYERVLTRYPRNAITGAANEFCLGCHMHIPPQLFNELQRGEKLITCPACKRVLFFRAPDKAEIENKAASG